MASTQNIKLYYFDLKGRGEMLRLVMAASGREFEDVRLTHEEWAKLKPTMPFGQIPALEIDGVRYIQSLAIATYLAKESGLYGKTNLDGLKIDNVVQVTKDVLDKWGTGVFSETTTEAQKNAILEEVKAQEVPKMKEYLENVLRESGTGFFVGDGLTLADVAVYDTFTGVMTGMNTISPDIDKGTYPLLSANLKRVGAHKKIKAYVETRPESQW